jgi:transcriptional regulator with XRE-family HTH domain
MFSKGENMETFSVRLKDLREENNLTLKQLGNEIGVSDIAISRWENNKRTPNIDSLLALCKYFQVSADYLLGIEDL